MGWLLLAIATLVEVAGTVCLKLSDGASNLKFLISAMILYSVGFVTYSLVLTKLKLSVSYSIMSGSVALLVVLVGIVGFKESLTAIKLISFALIIAGIIGLRLGEV